MRTRLSTLIGALATALALAACSGEAGTVGGQDEAGPPRSGGTATIVQLTEPRTLDPATLGTLVVTNSLVGNSLYGQLLTVGDKGAIQYGLAESLSTSDGGRTWRLKLRDGLTFSDGTPFDAAAVQFNWQRLKDPKTGAGVIGVASFVKTMRPSGQTLDFTLTMPIAEFANSIADSLNWIASPRALQAGPQSFDAKPIGAGPFVLKSWQRNGQMVLERNTTYHDKPRPYLDKLVLTANGDSNQRYSTMTANGATGIVGSGPEFFARAGDDGLHTVTQQLNGGNVFAYNTRTAPFNDIRARQAVAFGVDKRAVNAAAYSGSAEMANALFAIGSPYNGSATLPAFDKARAQRLFDELAAEGKPVSFTITAYQTTENRRIAEAIQAQLRQYRNLTVKLSVLDFPAVLAQVSQRNFQLVTSIVFFNNPAPTLYNNLHSKSSGNIPGISDPGLDAALSDGLTSTDALARTSANQQIAARYRDLLPFLNTSRARFSLIFGDHLHGVTMYGTGAIRTDTMWMSS